MSILPDFLSGFWRPTVSAARGWRRPAASAAVAVGLGAALPLAVAWFEPLLLTLPASQVAALFAGSSVVATPQGYALPDAATPVVITAVCSAADFFAMVAGLVAWQLGRRHEGRNTATPVRR